MAHQMVTDLRLDVGSRIQRRYARALVTLYLVLLVLVGPVVLGLAWWMHFGRLTQNPKVNTLAVGGIFCFWTLVLNLWRVDWDEVGGWTYLWLWLTWAVLLIPVLAKCIGKVKVAMWKWFERKEEDHLDTWKRVEAERRKAVGLEVQRQMDREEPDLPTGYIALGKATEIVGDSDLPREGGLIRSLYNWIGLHEKAMLEHVLILGKSGFGKTTLLLQMIGEILDWRRNGIVYDIFVIDGKGDPADADQITTLMYKMTGRKVPLFTLDDPSRCSTFNPFTGSAFEIYDQMLAMLNLAEMTGPAIYWAESYKNILMFACGMTDPKVEGIEPPQSFAELAARVDLSVLKGMYVSRPELVAEIAAIPHEAFSPLQSRIVRWRNIFGPITGPEGFTFEDSGGAVFSIPSGALTETSKEFVFLLVEKVKQLMRHRKRPAVLFIDEFGMFGLENVLALLRMARSHGIAVVLSAQTIAALGKDLIQQQFLEGTGTKVLMRTDLPEAVGGVAGTKLQYEHSFQHKDGEPTQMGSSRLQHAYKVDMNRVREFEKGEAYIIQGQVALIRVHNYVPMPVDPDAIAPYPKRAVVEMPTVAMTSSTAPQAPKLKLRRPNTS